MSKIDYNKLQKFTRRASYNIHVSMNYFIPTIERYKKEYGLQLNPDFQRSHVWTEEQQIAYIEYLLRGGQADDIKFNHSAWMDISGRDNDGMVCVDGLQRTTAIMKFMNNELPVLGGHYLKDFINLHTSLLYIPFSINNLKTRKEVLQWYLELNSGGTVHTKEELDKVKVLLDKEVHNDTNN